jgi:alcohol dehydrogenase
VLISRRRGATGIRDGHRVGPRDAGRRALAPQFGADLAVDVTVEDPVAGLGRRTGGLADVVVDVTAKTPTAFAPARPVGTVVVAGTRGFGSGAPGFSLDMVVFNSKNCASSAPLGGPRRPSADLGGDVTAHRAASNLLMSGRYPFESLPRRCVCLEDVGEVLDTMAGEHDGVPPVHGVLIP